MSIMLPAFLRKALKIFAMVILALAAFIVIAVIYGELKVRWAKKQVDAFCGLVVIGQPVAGLENKAKEMHLYYRRTNGSNENDGSFHVWEGFVFHRWFCDVEFKDGKATNKKVTFVD